MSEKNTLSGPASDPDLIRNLQGLQTEQVNPATSQIDRLPTLQMLTLINQEDQKVPLAVQHELPQIATAVDQISERFRAGGRLVYCGAGTSGRLGILDASECPPTYGTDPGQVVGLIAGGPEALVRAVEGAEDNAQLGEQDLRQIKLNKQDALVGIAASGRTPYVLGAMSYARQVGALVIGLSCNPDSPVSQAADIAIAPVVGPEAISGSTRMKSGTAQKLVLNMLSTGVMIRMGKVFGNLMIDVRATNEKLRVRAAKIVDAATGSGLEPAVKMLEKTGYDVRLSVFALLAGLEPEQARIKLRAAGGRVSEALANLSREKGANP